MIKVFVMSKSISRRNVCSVVRVGHSSFPVGKSKLTTQRYVSNTTLPEADTESYIQPFPMSVRGDQPPSWKLKHLHCSEQENPDHWNSGQWLHKSASIIYWNQSSTTDVVCAPLWRGKTKTRSCQISSWVCLSKHTHFEIT